MAEILGKGGDAVFVQADISKESDAKKITDEAVRVYGRLDIPVNNAAAFVLRGLEATVEEWERSLGTNCYWNFSGQPVCQRTND